MGVQSWGIYILGVAYQLYGLEWATYYHYGFAAYQVIICLGA